MHADQAEYERAKYRVEHTPELEGYQDIILFDWDDDGHWEWVINALVSEIVDWCESIRRDEALDALETRVFDAEDTAARASE